jgi:hypothetical protein
MHTYIMSPLNNNNNNNNNNYFEREKSLKLIYL